MDLVCHGKFTKWPRAGEIYGLEVSGVGWLVSRILSDCPSDYPGERGGEGVGHYFDVYIQACL